MRNVARSKNPEIASIADELNRETNNLSTASFGGQVIDDLVLTAGVEVDISHNLKITPKYRIILRGAEQAIISDGPTPWDGQKIFLISNVDTVISLLILRS